jgi:hypothetical protein
MRFGLIDLLIAIFFGSIGAVPAELLYHMFPSYLTAAAIPVCAVCLYLAVAAPIYRKLRFKPLLLPSCPCCGKSQDGFHFIPGWPRVPFRCPTCKGEFAIWLDGEVGDGETWETPVLVLKWPYVLGRYKKMNKPTAIDPKQEEVSG